MTKNTDTQKLSLGLEVTIGTGKAVYIIHDIGYYRDEINYVYVIRQAVSAKTGKMTMSKKTIRSNALDTIKVAA